MDKYYFVANNAKEMFAHINKLKHTPDVSITKEMDFVGGEHSVILLFINDEPHIAILDYTNNVYYLSNGDDPDKIDKLIEEARNKK